MKSYFNNELAIDVKTSCAHEHDTEAWRPRAQRILVSSVLVIAECACVHVFMWVHVGGGGILVVHHGGSPVPVHVSVRVRACVRVCVCLCGCECAHTYVQAYKCTQRLRDRAGEN